MSNFNKLASFHRVFFKRAEELTPPEVNPKVKRIGPEEMNSADVPPTPNEPSYFGKGTDPVKKVGVPLENSKGFPIPSANYKNWLDDNYSSDTKIVGPNREGAYKSIDEALGATGDPNMFKNWSTKVRELGKDMSDNAPNKFLSIGRGAGPVNVTLPRTGNFLKTKNFPHSSSYEVPKPWYKFNPFSTPNYQRYAFMPDNMSLLKEKANAPDNSANMSPDLVDLHEKVHGGYSVAGPERIKSLAGVLEVLAPTNSKGNPMTSSDGAGAVRAEFGEHLPSVAKLHQFANESQATLYEIAAGARAAEDVTKNRFPGTFSGMNLSTMANYQRQYGPEALNTPTGQRFLQYQLEKSREVTTGEKYKKLIDIMRKEIGTPEAAPTAPE